MIRPYGKLEDWKPIELQNRARYRNRNRVKRRFAPPLIPGYFT